MEKLTSLFVVFFIMVNFFVSFSVFAEDIAEEPVNEETATVESVDSEEIATEEDVKASTLAVSGPYEYENLASGVRITKYNGTDVNLNIPSTIDGKAVVEISQGAFYWGNLETVTLPSSIKTIGNNAFRNQYKLYKVTLNSGLETIGEYAFCGDESLENIVIPSSVKNIGYRAFNGCSRLNSVTLNNGLEEIGAYCFASTNLNEVTIPSTVKVLGPESFEYIKTLRKVTINEGLTEIQGWTFASCPNLEYIYIPKSVTKLVLMQQFL